MTRTVAMGALLLGAGGLLLHCASSNDTASPQPGDGGAGPEAVASQGGGTDSGTSSDSGDRGDATDGGHGGGGSKDGGGATPTLPAGVTLQALDGESMTSTTTMTHDYFTRNGFTYATSSTYSGTSWDRTSFFPLECFYGLYDDVIPHFLDLRLNVSDAVTGNTDMDASFEPNGIWAIVGGGGSLENAVGNYAAGLHVDEQDPSVGIGAIPDDTQTGRFWDITETWNTLVGGDIGGTPMAQILSQGHYKTPGGTPRSVDVYSADLYWFAASVTSSGQSQGGCIFANPMAYGSPAASADQVARGSNYGNMIDVFRSYGNGTNMGNGSGAAGKSGAPSRIPLMSFVENHDGLVTGGRLITPPELNWAAWSALIHGARGLDYFTVAYGHNGGFDDTVQSGQTLSVYAQGKATNTLIANMAPILSSPFALGYVEVSPHGYVFPTYEANWLNGGVEVMAKWYQGGDYANSSGTFGNGFYLFATTRDSESQTNVSATFTIRDPNATSVTVVGESRTIGIVGGKFTDDFANAWTTHVYQIR